MDREMNNAFNPINDSDENIENKNEVVGKLKNRNSYQQEIARTKGLERKREKNRKKDKKKTKHKEKKVSVRKAVNLPASQPYVKMIDGEEKLAFRYNTRLSESALEAMPKETVNEDEFTVFFNVDSIDVTSLNEKFKADNSIYPRANIPYERYTGNRWNYETECNRLAWQLVALNSYLLYGKKGLIQRAVDSYRNITKTSKGSKYFNDDLFGGDIEKRKKAASLQMTGYFEYRIKGVLKKCRVNLCVDYVDYEKISDEFKAKYSVLPEEYDEDSFGKTSREFSNKDNILAIKLGYVNIENTAFQNAVKIIGITTVIKKAVELAKNQKEEMEQSEDDKTPENLVSDILTNAMEDFDGNDKEFYFDMENKTN